MHLDYIIVADVISPRPDGKLDLHGVGWDTIFAAAVPATHPRMDIAVRFLLSSHELESDHRVALEIQGADGHVVARLDAEVKPLAEDARAQIPAGRRVGIGLILNLANLAFPAFGDYQIVLTWDGNEAREPLQIFVAPLPFEETAQ